MTRRCRWRWASSSSASSRKSGSRWRSRGSRSTRRRAAYFAKLATPGEPWDIALGLWQPSYVDPYAYINQLFDARYIGGTNFARFSSKTVDQQMRKAARLLSGRNRDLAYGPSTSRSPVTSRRSPRSTFSPSRRWCRAGSGASSSGPSST